MSFERWENRLFDDRYADLCDYCEDEECTCEHDNDYDDPDTYYDEEDWL